MILRDMKNLEAALMLYCERTTGASNSLHKSLIRTRITLLRCQSPLCEIFARGPTVDAVDKSGKAMEHPI